MPRRSLTAAVIAALLLSAVPASRASAQATVSNGLRLVVPVTLSNLHPEVKKAGVACGVSGGKLKVSAHASTLVNVTGYAIDTTLTVFIPVTLDASSGSPTGSTSNWSCQPAAWGTFLATSDPALLLPNSQMIQLKVDRNGFQSGTVTW